MKHIYNSNHNSPHEASAIKQFTTTMQTSNVTKMWAWTACLACERNADHHIQLQLAYKILIKQIDFVPIVSMRYLPSINIGLQAMDPGWNMCSFIHNNVSKNGFQAGSSGKFCPLENSELSRPSSARLVSHSAIILVSSTFALNTATTSAFFTSWTWAHKKSCPICKLLSLHRKRYTSLL